MTTPPRLFISYSWSNPEHEQWVINLATDLSENGVHVIIDKWDLREGHDAFAFMEKMVTDPTITKVLLICDRAYSEKANQRAGGVGTETQIISAEIYARESQDKFVAIITERDEQGKPWLPAYYRSRIYIDLSEAERHAENFEKLLRWIFDKPLYERPQIGKPPSFITEPAVPSLGTSALARRVIDGFRGDKGYAGGALDEYLSLFAENLERIRPSNNPGTDYSEIITSIDGFAQPLSEFIQVQAILIRYANPITHTPSIHRFFERALSYFSPPTDTSAWRETDFDSFKFVVHELYLYTLSVFLQNNRLDAAELLLSRPYVIPVELMSHWRNQSSVDFTAIRAHLKSLEIRNARLNLCRLSLRADLLKERAKAVSVPFRNLMQADFVCFLRAALAQGRQWFPETLLYAQHHGPFEIFARAASREYLPAVLRLLGTADVAYLQALFADFASDYRKLPRWDYEHLEPSVLAGFSQLGTRE